MMGTPAVELIDRVIACVSESEVVKFAGDICSIPSFATEETPLSRWLQKFFESRGYEVEMQEVMPGNFQTIARLRGTGGGQDLMLNGHIDIDPLGIDCIDPWTPKVEGDKLVCWGLGNMKGGIAAMIMAAEAVRKSGVELKGDLVICPVVGETNEHGTNSGTHYLIAHGVTADAAIVPEPYGPPDVINTVCTGTTTLVIHTKGSCIGSRYNDERRLDFGCFDTDGKGGPVDAFRKMVKVLDALETMEMTHEPWAKMPDAPGMVVGTVKAGRGRDHDERSSYFYSDFCTAYAGFYFVPGQTPLTIRDDVIRTIEKLKEDDPYLEYEVEETTEDSALPPIDAPPDLAVIDTIKRSYSHVTGKEIRDTGWPAGMPSDHAYLIEVGIPAVCYGPSSGWTHEIDERHIHFSYIDELVLATKVIAASVVDFCNSERPSAGEEPS